MLQKVLLSIAVLIVITLGYFYYLFSSSPDPQLLKKCLTAKMNKVELCPNTSNYVLLENISDILIKTILMSEDYSFFYHSGFDFAEIQNSLEENLEEGRFKRGGSTISQQLVKNVFFSKEKSLIRKLREAIVTYKMEEVLNKELILERYLNVVELGPSIYGVKQAAQYYFGKTPDRVHLLEAAYLAHLLPSPVKYSRTYDKEALTDFSRTRILTLCKKLFSVNKISEEQFQAANDLIDDFPWKNLEPEALSRLNGTFLAPSVPDYLEEGAAEEKETNEEPTAEGATKEPLKETPEEPSAPHEDADSEETMTN